MIGKFKHRIRLITFYTRIAFGIADLDPQRIVSKGF